MSRSVWVKGYEGRYRIFDDGRVLSFCRREPAFMKPVPDNSRGYLMLLLTTDGICKKFKIHQLVAKHFVNGYKPGLQVNHKNCNKQDNRAENLEWVTGEENMRHAVANGIFKNNRRRPKGFRLSTGG